jgi:hypothetical protein
VVRWTLSNQLHTHKINIHCYELNGIPTQNSYATALTPVPKIMTLYRDRAFMKIKWDWIYLEYLWEEDIRDIDYI